MHLFLTCEGLKVLSHLVIQIKHCVFQHVALTVVYVTVKQIARTVSKDSTLTLEHVQVSST